MENYFQAIGRRKFRQNEPYEFTSTKTSARGSAAGLCRSCAEADRAQLHASDRMLSFQTDRTNTIFNERRGGRRGDGASRQRTKIDAGKCWWIVSNASTRNRRLPDLRRSTVWLPHALLRCRRGTSRAARSPRSGPPPRRCRSYTGRKGSPDSAECGSRRVRRNLKLQGVCVRRRLFRSPSHRTAYKFYFFLDSFFDSRLASLGSFLTASPGR